MRFGEEIILKKELTSEVDEVITAFFDSLPLVIRGIDPNNFFGNRDNKVTLELLSKRDIEGPFILQPINGSKIKLYLDSYLINNQEYKAPRLEADAGIDSDPRPRIRTYKTLPIPRPIKTWNYTLDIYLTSKEY